MTKFEYYLLLLLVNYFRFKLDESTIGAIKKEYDKFTIQFIQEIKGDK